MSAIREDGTCVRCRSIFGDAPRCSWCGVGRERIVRRIRRHKIGGKRGRNSGVHGTAKNK